MLGYRCKVIILTVARSFSRCCSTVTPVVFDSKNGSKKAVRDSSLTVSYLVDSCGFKQEAAMIAAKKINVKSTEKADEVVSLFRDYGFKERQISNILEKRPSLLVAKAEMSLKPKLDLLASLGASHEVLVMILVGCPEILQSSIHRTLVPSLEILRGILGSDENVLKAMSRCYRLLRYKLSSLLGPNIAVLREAGMTDDLILVFLKGRPSAFLKSPARLRELVDRASEIGFDPKRHEFIEALRILSGMRDKTWKEKVELYKKWGWSDNEVILAFKRCPQCMMTSEKKIDAFMSYFVNTLKLDPSYVARRSRLLTFSFMKRIIPRCSIIQYLLSKGVLGMEDFTLYDALSSSQSKFSKKFLFKYEKMLPELFGLYTKLTNGAVLSICPSIGSRDRLKHAKNIQLDG